MNAERVYDWHATVAVPDGTQLGTRLYSGVAKGGAQYGEEHARDDVRAYLRRNGIRGAIHVDVTAR